MKDSKRSRRKRSFSSSQSSSKSQRSQSSRSPSSHRHKKSHKSKHRKEYKRHRSRSNQRNQRKRSISKSNYKHKQTQYHKNSKQNNKMKQQISSNYQQTKRQQSPLKYEDTIKHSPRQRQQQVVINNNEQANPQKQLPCFEPSGILLQYYNARQGVSLTFHEPPESRQPLDQWRMYIFKGEEVLQPIMLTKSCYLIGKDERVADILAENPSISRQHAVIQFRLVQKRQTEGQFVQEVKPYVMDLKSTNGTSLNDEKIQSGRYYELLHRDVLKFGFSGREYVIVKWEEDQEE